MSLTREEWNEMWKSIKYIEGIAIHLHTPRKDLILMETRKIKELIQQVIGQME